MSEPTRYEPVRRVKVGESEWHAIVMISRGDGDWVRYDEYATLRARLAEEERERLKWESSCTVAWAAMERMQEDLATLRAEADRLRAVAESGAQLMAEATWFLRHAAKQGVTEHRGMSEMAERLAAHDAAFCRVTPLSNDMAAELAQRRTQQTEAPRPVLAAEAIIRREAPMAHSVIGRGLRRLSAILDGWRLGPP